MLAHYLAVALAKFRKTPFTTAANVLTLALGLACFIAAFGIASWWRLSDSYHARADQTFVFGVVFTAAGGVPTPMNVRTPATLAPYLREDFPELETVVRVFAEEEVPVAAGESKQLLNAAFAEPDFLKVFDFEFVAGSREALAEPGGVVLTEDAAARLFGDAPALGRTLRLSDSRDAVVTGVIKAVRPPSFMGASSDVELRFDMIGDWGSSPGGIDRDTRPFWQGANSYTFGVLRPGASIAAVNEKLPAFIERRAPRETLDAIALHVEAFPVSEIATRTLDALLFAQSGAGLTATLALIGLGLLILGVACVNYASLASAQAVAGAKDVCLRKVLGAGRGQVMAQSWTETALLSLAAVAVALLVLGAAVPFVRTRIGVDPLYFLGQGLAPLAALGGLVVAVTLLAGGYPALVLSRVRPVNALRPGRARGGSRLLAGALVGVQFASAGFLLILVAAGQQQRLHLEEAALAPHADPIVALNDLKPLGISFETFEATLRDIPDVESVTVSDRLPWTTRRSVISFARSEDAGAVAPDGFLKQVGYDYFETLDLPLIAGRVFERGREVQPTVLMGDNGAEPIPMVIDRLYAQALGFETPEAAVGAVVWMPEAATRSFGRPRQAARIVGVVEADRMRMGATSERGHMYFFAPGARSASGQIPVVKIAAASLPETLQRIEAAWDRLAPNVALNARFLDGLFEQAYRQYARIGEAFLLLASTAFVIASIGLLGMAVHGASRRRHEIGVRKTLGSTTLGIVRLLLTDFTKPVLVANLLAWPAGYLAAQTYLSAFAERAPLTPAPFVVSLALTLVIAWAAVIGEVLKAASVRPAEVLRQA
jgi:putative ABC transport system permease protein